MSIIFYKDIPVRLFSDVIIHFSWPYKSESVEVSGSFDGWQQRIPLLRNEGSDNWYRSLSFFPTTERSEYKYIVGGRWMVNRNEPVTKDPSGKYENNFFQISRSLRSRQREIPSDQRLVYFSWIDSTARNVYLVGEFDGWNTFFQMERASDGKFYGSLILNEGKSFRYKYFVDGSWQCNSDTEITEKDYSRGFFLFGEPKQSEITEDVYNIVYVPYRDEAGAGMDIMENNRIDFDLETEQTDGSGSFDYLNLNFGSVVAQSVGAMSSGSMSPSLALYHKHLSGSNEENEFIRPTKRISKELLNTMLYSRIENADVDFSEQGMEENLSRLHCVHELLESALSGRKVSERLAISITDRVRIPLEDDPNLPRLDGEVCIISDLHGRYDHLIPILEQLGYLCGEIKMKLVILGDVVDAEGPPENRCSVVTILLCFALKIAFPDSVFITRGNHETRECDRSWEGGTNAKSFWNEVMELYDLEFLSMMNSCFDLLPLGVLIQNRILCLHGGISPSLNSLEDIDFLDRRGEPGYCGLHLDVLWGDPYPEFMYQYDSFSSNESRGCSYYFGQSDLEQFLVVNGLSTLVRGHGHPSAGYNVRKSPLSLLITIHTGWNASERISYALVDSGGAISLIGGEMRRNEYSGLQKLETAGNCSPRIPVGNLGTIIWNEVERFHEAGDIHEKEQV